MRYNKDSFIKALKEKYNEPFEIIEFKGTSKPGKYKCGYCNKEYELYRMGKLLALERKHLCLHCFRSQYAEKVLEVFKFIENISFKNFGYNKKLNKPTVIYSCKKCGLFTEKPYVEFLKYPACIHCGENSKRRLSSTIPIPEEFELLEEYENQYVKKLFRHNKCGFIFKVRPKDLINGHTYCPKCSKKSSKGERKIIETLSKLKINFIKEKTFDWSNSKRYDFFLPEYNLIIEYNGIQHYKEVPNFFLPLKEQQEIDKWKKEQAKKHGIDYFIISYLDFNDIEKILVQRLKENT